MLSKEFVIEKVTSLLPIDSDLYDRQVDILVYSAMSKLKEEGVDSSLLNEEDDRALDYCVCVSYQVALDLDANANFEKTMQQYITRVNTLRTSMCTG